jgi:hypothetical protein
MKNGSDSGRPQVAGKFLFAGGEKSYARGVTYGPFRLRAGSEFDRLQTNLDFDQITAKGINAVRTYTTPPDWFLDAAHVHGLRVMAGIPWEQHVTFLDEPARAKHIETKPCVPPPVTPRSCAT